MCVPNQTYPFGCHSSPCPEGVSSPTSPCAQRSPRPLNIAIYNFPLPPISGQQWSLRSRSFLSPLRHKRPKVHYAFETVAEVPEELEDEKKVNVITLGAREEEIPTVTEMVADMLQQLTTNNTTASRGSSARRENTSNNSYGFLTACSKPSSPCPSPVRARPLTPYPPGKIPAKSIEPNNPRPKPRPGAPPGPPPPYPPPPLPGTMGKFYQGAEISRSQEGIRLKMVTIPKDLCGCGDMPCGRYVEKIPGNLRRNNLRTPRKRLTLEEQRWGVIAVESMEMSIPQNTLARSRRKSQESRSHETPIDYNHTSRIWNSINSITRLEDEAKPTKNTTRMEASSYSEPVSPTTLAPRKTFQNFEPYAETSPKPGISTAWEFPVGSGAGDPNSQPAKKQAVLDFFTYPKLGLSRLRSVASLGSLRKASSSSEGSFASNRGGSFSSIASSTMSKSSSEQKSISGDGVFLTWQKRKGTISRV